MSAVSCRRSLLARLLTLHNQKRAVSSTTEKTSKAVRQRFLDYFVKEHGHTFIRSSSVVPFFDPTVPFVNAGMNQFKGVFLGQDIPPCNRAANSQKCIRVGGKHNDLAVVGTDGYHHTFFEMLGSWSFGDYFKEQACQLAWELLTGPYGLNVDRLYVTYFGGDEAMGLGPDLETCNIWRQIGVPADHILPFGAADNFWEMGPCGPCGPCTEIHVDHITGRCNAAERVNMGHEDLTEIWNLVFIQYNRALDGSLTQLPQCHVDTGMGFERLVALLQGKRSNYDTDLFQPLFTTISKCTGAPAYSGRFGVQDHSGLDASYRILADHARMVTVALADNTFPDHNPKLRRILRRALALSRKSFRCDQSLLVELSTCVAESLAETYPEIGHRIKQVQLMIRHEEELLQSLRASSTGEWEQIAASEPSLQALDVGELPGLVAGYRTLNGVQSVSAELAFRLYDTFGLEESVVATLARVRGLSVDLEGFRQIMHDTRICSKKRHVSEVDTGGEVALDVLDHLQQTGVPPTNDSAKYEYSYSEEGLYVFPAVQCKVQAIIDAKCLVPRAHTGMTCGVIMDRTNFYHEAGGQASDTGHLILRDGTKVPITDITNVRGYLVHKVNLEVDKGCSFGVGDTVTLQVCPEHRLAHMRNHTATHLLNAAVRDLLTATCQQSSHVTHTHLTLDFTLYGEKFASEDVASVEEKVCGSITIGRPVRRRTVSACELHNGNVTLVPGEVYPQNGIHLIEIEADDLISREACCGTHVLNTGDIGAFSVVSLQVPGAGTRSLRAVTGSCAVDTIHAGEQVSEKVARLELEVRSLLDMGTTIQQAEALEKKLQSLRKELTSENRHLLPYLTRSHSLDTLGVLSKALKDGTRGTLRGLLESEMQDVLNADGNSRSFIVHYLKCSSTLDSVPLQKATRLCPDLPVLLLARSEGVVKARCCVPEPLATDHFNAQLWMQPVLAAFRAQGSPPRGQDARHVFNMKGKKVKADKLETLVESALQGASEFAEVALQGTSRTYNGQISKLYTTVK